MNTRSFLYVLWCRDILSTYDFLYLQEESFKLDTNNFELALLGWLYVKK